MVHYNQQSNDFHMSQVALRLREFATVRAMECHTAAVAAASKAGGDSAAVLDVAMLAGQGVESGKPCKLRLQTAQVVLYLSCVLCASLGLFLRLLNLASSYVQKSQ